MDDSLELAGATSGTVPCVEEVSTHSDYGLVFPHGITLQLPVYVYMYMCKYYVLVRYINFTVQAYILG